MIIWFIEYQGKGTGFPPGKKGRFLVKNVLISIFCKQTDAFL